MSQVGCGKREEITDYTVPNPHLASAANHDTGAKIAPGKSMNPHAAVDPHRIMGHSDGDSEVRLIAAVVPQGARTWFFKLAGADEQVGKKVDEFSAFIRSIRFSEGEASRPSWTLPTGWRQQAGSGMRFATLEIGSGKTPLQLSVISLPTPKDGFTEYLLANINRWRVQLGLKEIAEDQLPGGEHPSDELTQLDVDGLTVTVVNFAGRVKPARKGMTMPSSGQGMIHGSGANRPLSYKTPEGWSASKTGGMRKAAFVVKQGEQQAEITVIDLDVSAGELLPNVNRWRQQIELKTFKQQELDREVKQLKVDGAVGHYVELVGPDNAKSRETILGVIVIHAGRAWFFKLKGDAVLAEREKERFESFVQSVKFQSPRGAGHDN